MTVGKLDLTALEARDAFIHRHIGPSEADIADMLDDLPAQQSTGNLDELFCMGERTGKRYAVPANE